MAAGRDELSSGLKVFELREKLAEFGLSTQGNKETLRERLASFLDAEGNKDHDTFSDDPPYETEMTNFIASSTQVTIPVIDSASGTDGSQDLEAFDIKAKLNSVCEDIELLKLNFEALKRSTDLSTKSGSVEALERENLALKAKLKEVEAERDSLKLALTFLAKDMNDLTCNLISTEKRNQSSGQTTEEAPWHLVGLKKKKKTQDLHSKENAAKNTKKTKKTQSMATPEPQPQQSLDANSDQASTKKHVLVIAGDSLIKNVQGWRVSKATKVKTVVKAFPGASVEDMFDYTNPTVKHRPEEIILHVGTNDLKNSDSRKVAERIVDLGNFIEAESSNTKVTISNLLPRTDDPALNSKANQVNKILRTFANRNDWKIISHPNITGEHLNSSGVHLTLSGTKAFSSDFVMLKIFEFLMNCLVFRENHFT